MPSEQGTSEPFGPWRYKQAEGGVVQITTKEFSKLEMHYGQCNEDGGVPPACTGRKCPGSHHRTWVFHAVSTAAELLVGHSIPVLATSHNSVCFAIACNNYCGFMRKRELGYLVAEVIKFLANFSKGGCLTGGVEPLPWADVPIKPRTRQLAPQKCKPILWLASCGKCN